MNQNTSQDYTVFGGWLLVFYWCAIISGALTLLLMGLPALIGITASFMIYGLVYGIGTSVLIVSICIAAAFFVKSAIEMKARKPQFFDTLMLALLINIGGGIVSGLLTIRSAYGIGSFISSTIGSIIGFAIGACLVIMYYSKSVRVKVYFSGRPVQSSRYWNWIKLLPPFIISESMPDPNKIQQMVNPPQTGQSQHTQPPSPTQSGEKLKFCGECGVKNESGTKFCGSCGKPME
jgi:hypothetical protein